MLPGEVGPIVGHGVAPQKLAQEERVGRMGQVEERLGVELTDALPREAQRPPDGRQRLGRTIQTVAGGDDGLQAGGSEAPAWRTASRRSPASTTSGGSGDSCRG